MQKIYSLVLASIIGLSLFAHPVSAPKILRGPYLQSPGPYSIILRWRTDTASDSKVTYSTQLNDPSPATASDPAITTEHRVKISGLSQRTKYYYSVGSTSAILRGPEEQLHFTTAPDSTNPVPVRFWVIGDFGHGNDAERKVRDSYLNYVAPTHPADVQLWVGDNAYEDGTDVEFQNNVFDTVNCFGNVFTNLPFASASGNHDYNSICPWQPALCTQDPNTHTGPYLSIIDPPTHGELGGVPSNLKLFYSFDYGDIHFVVLNSELGSFTPAYNWLGVLNTDTNFTSPMLDWLKQDLASTTKKWKVALWHQCPYSGQNNFTDDGVQQFCIATRVHFNPILERYGIDLVLTGHDHNYQRSYLINGHYGYKNTFDPSMLINGTSGNDGLGEAYIKYTNGPMANKGAVYLIQGNSSEGNDYSPISHPAIYWGEACDTCFGSTIIDVNGDRLDGQYITSNGVVRDQFTIKKQAWTGIIDEKPVSDNVYVYPNPFHGQTMLGYTLLKKCVVKIDALDISGKVVHSIFNGMREPGSYRDILDLEKPSIPQGAYLIRLDCSGTVKYKKVLDLDKER